MPIVTRGQLQLDRFSDSSNTQQNDPTINAAVVIRMVQRQAHLLCLVKCGAGNQGSPITTIASAPGIVEGTPPGNKCQQEAMAAIRLEGISKDVQFLLLAC